jgi:NAD(P)-dependent dehydrogenase (short-subunit alcohol dehydrogenase family)
MASQDGFAGQVVLVTGGAGGIGWATAEAFAEAGANVVACEHQRTRNDTDASLRGEVRCRIKRVRLDVTNAADVQRVVQEIINGFGRLDVLVNAAGVTSFGSAESLTEQEWDRVLNINLKGTFLCCRAVMSQMRKQGYGRIINLGSVVGKNCGNARPWISPDEQLVAGNVAYGVSKIAVHTMTGFLAKELAPFGVTANVVAPGPVATAMTTNFPEKLRANIPVGRMGSLSDVANAILFLASPKSAFITGEVLDVNGGMWCD